MKRIFFISLIHVLFFQLISNDALCNSNYTNNLNDLSEINSQWQFHTSDVPVYSFKANNDIEAIQFHLKLVCNSLLKNTPTDLSKSQLKNRLELIKTLNQYADAKSFPTNHYHATRRPYFVDNFGVHCAVGFLMKESGYSELVLQIKAEHNHDYIADIKTEGVSEWAEKHGFTLDELKWIQPTYPPMATISPLGTGTNGTVNEVKYDYYGGGRIVISGKFTTLNDVLCSNIGYFKNGEMNCIGDGISGEVNSVIPNSDGLLAFGALEDGTTVYPAARFDGVNWNFISIPGRDSAVCTAVTLGGSGYYAQAAISHDSIPGMQEIWFLNYGLTWEKKAMVKGVVLDATFTNLGRIFVGHFDSLYVFDAFGAINEIYQVTNIAIKENLGAAWYGLNGDVSDTLKAVKSVGDNIYFGGTCSSNPGISDICLTRYLNGVFQPLFIKESYMGLNDFSINTIEFKSGSTLIVGGDFLMEPAMVGNYGNNLAVFSMIYNSLDPQAIFDAPVNSVAYLGNTLYIGGEFNTNMTFSQLNHVGRIISYVDLEDQNSSDQITVFPNPFSDFIQLTGINDGTSFQITNTIGQIVRSGKVEDQKINDLSELPSGSYFLEVFTEEDILVKKIVK